MQAARPTRPRCSGTGTARSALGPNSFVVINDGVNDSIAVDTEACEIKPTWNAAVCKGDVGRMSFVNGRGLGFDAISGGLAPGAPLPPVILSRKGKEISIPVGTNVRAGTEFKATTERTSMDLHLIELDAGSWVIVEIPGFTKAASGTSVDSLDALRKASDHLVLQGQGCTVGQAGLPR